MVLRKILSLVSLTFTVFCFFIGFAMARQWIACALTFIPVLAWIYANKWPFTWLATTALLVFVSLAAIGLITGASPFLMFMGAILALFNWNIVFLNHDRLANSTSKAVTLLEKKDYISLLLAFGLSFLIIGARFLRLQIPFGGMILLVPFAFFCLVHTWRLLSK